MRVLLLGLTLLACTGCSKDRSSARYAASPTTAPANDAQSTAAVESASSAAAATDTAVAPSGDLLAFGWVEESYQGPGDMTRIEVLSEDIALLGNVRLMVDTGEGFERNPAPLNDDYGWPLGGGAGTWHFTHQSLPGSARRYQVLGVRDGVQVASNVVVVQANAAAPRQLQILEPAGIPFPTSVFAPPQVPAPDRLTWTPTQGRALIWLHRIDGIVLGPQGYSGERILQAAIETDANDHELGAAALTTWAGNPDTLAPGTYSLSILTLDADGWVSGYSSSFGVWTSGDWYFEVR